MSETDQISSFGDFYNRPLAEGVLLLTSTYITAVKVLKKGDDYDKR